MIYLASPYTDVDPGVEEMRYQEVARATATLMSLGNLMVFSPIVHCHPLRRYAKLPGDWAFWQNYDRHMIGTCSTFAVLMLPGWDRSTGLRNEGVLAKLRGLDPIAVDPAHVYASIETLRQHEIERGQLWLHC